MDPAPLEHRRWTSWTFFAYWISDLITPGGWATSSSFVEMGLTWWESCLAMYVGGFLVAIVITGEYQKPSDFSVPSTLIAYQVYQFSQWYHWCQGQSTKVILHIIPLLIQPLVAPHAIRYHFSIGLWLLGFQVRRLLPNGLCLFLAQYQLLVVCPCPLPPLSSQDFYADIYRTEAECLSAS